MSWPIGVVLCLLQAQGSEPTVDRKVSLEMVAAPVQDIALALSKKTGVRVTIAPSASLLKATVLVHDQPLDQVVETLGDVLELQCSKLGKTLTLTPDASLQAARLRYDKAEDELLFARIRVALPALSKAVANPARAPEEEPEPRRLTDDVLHNPTKLEEWAVSKARNPVYRALAAYYQSNPISVYTIVDWPYSYSLGPLVTPASQIYLVRSFDNLLPSSNGVRILVKYMHLTGDLQFLDIDSPRLMSLEAETPLVRYPQPPAELKEYPFAKYLAAWEKPRDKALPEGFEKGFEEYDGEEPPLETEAVLGDHLRWIYHHSKVSIVADAFRVPAHDQRPGQHGRTPEQYFNALKKTESFSMKADRSMVQIKSGGYWRLMRSEPPEPEVLAMEAIAAKGEPGIFDYADFMFESDYVSYVRFAEHGRFVAKFSTRPLERARSAFYHLGAINRLQRVNLMRGNIVDVQLTSSGRSSRLNSYVGLRKLLLQSEDFLRQMPDIAGGGYASADALFEGGRPVGRGAEFLECTDRPESFLRSEHRWDPRASSLILGHYTHLSSEGTLWIMTSMVDGFVYRLF